MILKIKRNNDGSVKNFKARLLAGGHEQHEDDFDDIYAEVCNL